jgi:hypothetical protein
MSDLLTIQRWEDFKLRIHNHNLNFDITSTEIVIYNDEVVLYNCDNIIAAHAFIHGYTSSRLIN